MTAIQYAKCVKCDYIQPLNNEQAEYFICSMCETKNSVERRILVFINDNFVATGLSKIKELLSQWDIAVANLIGQKSRYTGVRLRNCALQYNETEHKYFITYCGDIFKPEEIELVALAEVE